MADLAGIIRRIVPGCLLGRSAQLASLASPLPALCRSFITSSAQQADEAPSTSAAAAPAEGPRPPKRPTKVSDSLTQDLIAQARESFTRRPEERGQLPPLPPDVREALYGGCWDRVLVDVNMSSERGKDGTKVAVFSAMVATGNMKGLFGLGFATSETAQLATARAHLDSINRLTAVPLYRGHTIYHRVDHEYHRMKMQLEPRPEGWGLRCSDLLYELCNLAGIRDVSIKIRGRRKNKFFVAKCFQEALLRQTTPHDGVEATGMYIREVPRKGL